jgi:ribosomal protein S18 acetylase RimI-like enzyme
MLEIALAEDCQGLWPLLLLADPDKEIVKEYIDSCSIYVAKSNDQIVGLLALSNESAEECEIKNIAVSPVFQNQGIGRQLLNHAKLIANQSNMRLKICTANTSKHQLSLYESVGFTISTILKGYFIKKYPEPLFENGARCEDLHSNVY